MLFIVFVEDACVKQRSLAKKIPREVAADTNGRTRFVEAARV
jgi:hypothetical protein